MKKETEEAVRRAVNESKRRKELIYIAAHIYPSIAETQGLNSHTSGHVMYRAKELLRDIDNEIEKEIRK